jgi:hypothetical protein
MVFDEDHFSCSQLYEETMFIAGLNEMQRLLLIIPYIFSKIQYGGTFQY